MKEQYKQKREKRTNRRQNERMSGRKKEGIKKAEKEKRRVNERKNEIKYKRITIGMAEKKIGMNEDFLDDTEKSSVQKKKKKNGKFNLTNAPGIFRR